MNESSGFLLIDKPKGWTSYQVVNYLKRKFRIKKIGHAGTLDPLATGLLIILIGSYTKKFDELQKLPKEYEAVMEFGKKTDTYDREGKITYRHQKDFEIKKPELEKALKNFIGEIEQMPPAFSALKIQGKPAYKLARQGIKLEMKPRKAVVYGAKIIKISGKKAWVSFSVSSGTYIRSLANDIGEKLEVGAYLYNLKRTEIGGFSLKAAKKPEQISLEDLRI